MNDTLPAILKLKGESRLQDSRKANMKSEDEDKYLLQVTAGPSYNTSTHSIIPVNGPTAHRIENEFMTVWLRVRIRDYNGLPKESPLNDEYFSHPLHQRDRYSIGFSFVPKESIPGQDLIMGFDFDRPIRDRLPPGFKKAMKIVTTIIDPGIYSDPYSDKPYLYAPALSTFFTFRLGALISEVDAERQLSDLAARDKAGVIEEGADGSGQKSRDEAAIPEEAEKRRKYFLKRKNLEQNVFEADRLYQGDFFNPYLDFANFGLKLPGFSISITKYIDDKTHTLRFVFKNRATGDVYFVCVFTLLFGQALRDALASSTADSEEKVETEPGAPSTESQSERDSDRQDENKEKAASAVGGGLIGRLYSALSLLGFTQTVHPSNPAKSILTSSVPRHSLESSSASSSGSKGVNNFGDETVEEFLRWQHSNSRGR
ncbi:DUF1769-domain-containing protein [Patellaria atrata CBS 101060]|uniref:DUF1769-domain-containing protein n=1 Tax=Patellaria atrata CBS 101060 TaxID=1346257 RepID=A0A9P4VNN1_9PEZI|nr:DUF1769-domain-containing protein [Patellaria atrata CBS 101060]